LSKGRSCLGLNYIAPAPCSVLLLSCEDGYQDTVVPRLMAADADPRRIRRVDGIRGIDGKVLPFCLAYYQQLEEELVQRRDVRIVIIDPAGAYVGRSGIDDHKDSELRALMDRLAELAARRRVTILLVKHFNKLNSARALHRISGSSADAGRACRVCRGA
jgi:RecA-family ATPase